MDVRSIDFNYLIGGYNDIKKYWKINECYYTTVNEMYRCIYFNCYFIDCQ